MGKGSPADIDDHPVEGFPLTLMDGNGPGQLEGILGERAQGFGINFPDFLIKRISEDLPGKRGDRDDKVTRKFHPDDILFPGLVNDLADFTD